MIRFGIYAMVFLGSGLMAINIVRYLRFIRNIQLKGEWEKERFILYFTLGLLVMFLLGYLVVGFVGQPDFVMAGILFFGSVFVAFMLLLLQRVTLRIQENEHLEAKLMAAEESNRAKTGFLSHMSHEIRTPLNAIIGFNNLALKDETLTEQTREYLVKTGSSSQHLLLLINDILDMSQLESGYMEIKSEEFSIQELITPVNEMIKSQCEAKGLAYGFTARGPMGGYRYVSDLGKLKQVLLNLLSNSVKYTPVPGSVSFLVDIQDAQEGRKVFTFQVRDTGIGMESDFLQRIFEPFAREDESVRNPYGGTGLGLSITKSLVDLMGGEITVESKKDKGSVFTLQLTLACFRTTEEIVTFEGEEEERQSASSREEDKAQDKPTTGSSEKAGYGLEGVRVLIVEDMLINAEILEDILEEEGVKSDWAENGKVGVDTFAACKAGTYDAIFMDMRMPVMDGLAATRAIRELPRSDAKTIPILALTANAFDTDAKLCLDAGMDYHLTKPIDADLMFKTLGRFVREGREAGSEAS